MSSKGNSLDVVGIVPAAGEASRLSPIPCSKELMPIGFGDLLGRPRPKVVSHYLLEKYNRAGVSKVYVILRKGKWDIPGYFADGSMLGMHFAYLMMNLPYGVPYTLDQAYPFVKDSKVMMGFPDMLFGPDDAFVHADRTLGKKGADVVLGLYPPRDERQVKKCDMVQWDDESGRLQRIVVKPETSALAWLWIFAIWTPVFTEFMHDYLLREQKGREATSREVHLGHAVQAAIDQGLNVYGHPFPDDYMIDIGTPDELAEAYKRFHHLPKGK